MPEGRDNFCFIFTAHGAGKQACALFGTTCFFSHFSTVETVRCYRCVAVLITTATVGAGVGGIALRLTSGRGYCRNIVVTNCAHISCLFVRIVSCTNAGVLPLFGTGRICCALPFTPIVPESGEGLRHSFHFCRTYGAISNQVAAAGCLTTGFHPVFFDRCLWGMPEGICIVIHIRILAAGAGVSCVALRRAGRGCHNRNIVVPEGIHISCLLVRSISFTNAGVLPLFGTGRSCRLLPVAPIVTESRNGSGIGIPAVFAAVAAASRSGASRRRYHRFGVAVPCCRGFIGNVGIPAAAAGVGCVAFCGAGRSSHACLVVVNMPVRKEVLVVI